MSASAINDVVNTVGRQVRANTEQENQWLASAPPEMQAQMRSQMEMQKEQELVQLLAQAMKQTSEMSKSVIRNVGG
jgi:LPS O-antigen subunit length determinant protein (WzzB/FepE family)